MSKTISSLGSTQLTTRSDTAFIFSDTEKGHGPILIPFACRNVLLEHDFSKSFGSEGKKWAGIAENEDQASLSKNEHPNFAFDGHRMRSSTISPLLVELRTGSDRAF